jgi:hypothetical protein
MALRWLIKKPGKAHKRRSRMPVAIVEFLKTLWAGFCLSFFIVPKRIKPLRPSLHFWLVQPLGIACSLGLEYFAVANYKVFWTANGIAADALYAMLLLASFTLVAHFFRKQVLVFSAATLASVAFSLPYVVCNAVELVVRLPTGLMSGVLALWWMLSIWQICKYTQLSAKRLNSALAAVVVVAITLWPFSGPYSLDLARYSYLDDSLYSEEASAREPVVKFDPEALMYAQRGLLEQSLQQLRPQTPGVVDLYVIAFAGDAKEDTFINEVRYAEKLFSQRFNAKGNVIVLANSEQTLKNRPLANATNLKASLRAISKKMDVEEDLLLLFMTTHGSEDHELSVDLYPVALNQISPQMIAEAYRSAGIRKHISIISACYSGGFINALRGDDAVVMTAARADRTSFGCGGDFDMTFFGRAYFQKALNQTSDLIKAFEIAQRDIAEREKSMGFEPSEPQIDIGSNAIDHLNRWKRELIPGDPVPFFVEGKPAKERP